MLHLNTYVMGVLKYFNYISAGRGDRFKLQNLTSVMSMDDSDVKRIVQSIGWKMALT